MAEAIKAQDFEKAMSLRDAEFRENLDGFIATSILVMEPLLPPEKVGFRYTNLKKLMLMTSLPLEDTGGHHAVRPMSARVNG